MLYALISVSKREISSSKNISLVPRDFTIASCSVRFFASRSLLLASFALRSSRRANSSLVSATSLSVTIASLSFFADLLRVDFSCTFESLSTRPCKEVETPCMSVRKFENNSFSAVPIDLIFSIIAFVRLFIRSNAASITNALSELKRELPASNLGCDTVLSVFFAGVFWIPVTVIPSNIFLSSFAFSAKKVKSSSFFSETGMSLKSVASWSEIFFISDKIVLSSNFTGITLPLEVDGASFGSDCFGCCLASSCSIFSLFSLALISCSSVAIADLSAACFASTDCSFCCSTCVSSCVTCLRSC